MNLAYLKNEHDLFEKVCKFVFKNKPFGEKAWQDMIKNNPDYVIEILKVLIWKQKYNKSSFQVSFKDQFY